MDAKERGNKEFQAANWQAAADWYTAALEQEPSLVAALANRAAAAINMRQWASGLADCDAALALECPPGLRIKVLWRKAVCLRHLGQSEAEWQAVLHAGLALDPLNAKLGDEQQFLFVRRVAAMPAVYSAAGTTVTISSPAIQAHAAPPRSTGKSTLYMSLPRPLTYAGVLKLTRDKTAAAYDYWYTQVTPDEIVEAHRNAGIEPATLDYVHEMIISHPEHRSKNAALMHALQRSARYESASMLADEPLYQRAASVAGLN